MYPSPKAEFTDIGELLTLLVDDDFVQIAEIDGQPVAMVVALPNINEVIRDLDGRLLPFGWLKLLWRHQGAFPDQRPGTADGRAQGLPEYPAWCRAGVSGY